MRTDEERELLSEELEEDAPPPQRRFRGVAAALVPIVGIVTLLGVSLGRDPRATPSELVGEPAPSFSLRDLNSGASVSLARFRGRPVVVNFWASWCRPCWQEHVVLQQAWSTASRADVAFLSVLYQDRPSEARRFDADVGKPWPDLEDPGASTALDYGVAGVPETFFIDRHGIVVHKENGPVTAGVLSYWLDRLTTQEGS